MKPYISRSREWLTLVALLAGCATNPNIAPDRGLVNAPTVEPGMAWTYQQIDDYTKLDRGQYRIEVEEVDTAQIRAVNSGTFGTARETYDRNWGWIDVSTRGWDWLSRWNGRSQMVQFSAPFDSLPFPLSAGQSWTDALIATDPESGQQRPVRVISTARYWEKINVPAGEFVALRIERVVYPQDAEWYKSKTWLVQIDWYAPEVNRIVSYWHDSSFYDYRQRPPGAYILGDRFRWELIEYKPGP